MIWTLTKMGLNEVGICADSWPSRSTIVRVVNICNLYNITLSHVSRKALCLYSCTSLSRIPVFSFSSIHKLLLMKQLLVRWTKCRWIESLDNEIPLEDHLKRQQTMELSLVRWIKCCWIESLDNGIPLWRPPKTTTNNGIVPCEMNKALLNRIVRQQIPS